MRAVIQLLVLLFSMCGVQTESQNTGTTAAPDDDAIQLDVYAELRELRHTVVELRVLLTVTQTELKNTKAELLNMEAEMMNLVKDNSAQTADLRSVSERLAATETDIEHVKNADNAAQHTDLATMKTEVMNLIKEYAAQETRLAASETEVENLIKENAAQETRLAASETEVENLKMETAAQETRLSTSETEVKDLKMETAAQETRLAASETEVENLKIETAAQEAELTAVATRLAATETDVVNLEKEITDQPKVAFSAALTNSGTISSGNTELNLVFTKIITNIGQAYSSMTGFFTAPVKGVYYFRFTVMESSATNWLRIKMFKNGGQIMYLLESKGGGSYNYLSSGATLQLEVGDVVNMRLPAGYRLYDSSYNQSTFSGFLLFTL